MEHKSMSTAFLIIKTVGDFVLPVLGIFVGLCAISKKLSKLVRDTEASMKSSHLARYVFGAVLIVFSASYIVSNVKLGMEDAKTKSPVYHHQIVLKSHIRNLASTIRRDEADGKNRVLGVEADLDLEIDAFVRQAREEGLDTKDLLKKFQNAEMNGSMDADVWRGVAEELDKLADQLPKPE